MVADRSNSPSARLIPWRLLLWTAVLACFGSMGVYLADRIVLEPRREQERRLEELERRKKELEQFAQRLKHNERRAQVYVLHQETTPDQKIMTTIRFVEIDAESNPVQEYPEFTFEGDELYVDAFVIKFKDEFVEQGDALKGKSLLLFRRIFSNRMQPDSGYALDKKGLAPLAYASQAASSDFERELWNKFWSIPDDAALREKYGVRAAHGTAACLKVKRSDFCILEVRSTGEVTLRKHPEKASAAP